MSMDWRSLGYWPVWKDGKKVWVPKDKVTDSASSDAQDCLLISILRRTLSGRIKLCKCIGLKEIKDQIRI